MAVGVLLPMGEVISSHSTLMKNPRNYCAIICTDCFRLRKLKKKSSNFEDIYSYIIFIIHIYNT